MAEPIYECVWETFSNSSISLEDKCEIASSCNFQYFNLISLNYCYLHGWNPLTTIIALAILVFCFYFISSTGDAYLAPSLGIMSEKLGLSQNLAGLTLIAFG